MRSQLPILLLLLSYFTASADNARFVTVTMTNAPDRIGSYFMATNSIEIAEGEAGELMTVLGAAGAYVTKAGMKFVLYVAASGFNASPSATVVGPIVNGPATFTMYAQNTSPVTGLMTVQITPQTFDLNRTIILPPGTNQVSIALETSTNLVSWVTATNGVYGSPDEARFFRIHMQKP